MSVVSRLALAAALLSLGFSASGSAHLVAGPGSAAFPGRNGEILFSSLRVPNGREWLYLMRPDGTHQRPITRAPRHVAKPTWSPDGNWIAYTATRKPAGSCPQLYMMRVDGTRVRRLAHDSYCYDNAAWSPDGRRIAFLRYRTGGPGSKYSISAMNVDGTGLRRLTNGNRDHDPAWSPDGTTIAFARNYPEAIWLMNADGSDQRQLTTPRQDRDSGDKEDFGPDWSPNSNWIAFSRVHEPHMGRTGGTRYRIDIYVIGTDGTGLRRLTRLAGMNSWPAWSPDGRRIVFESDRSHEDLSDIYVMNGDGKRQTRLTKGPVIHESPDWRPRP